MSGSSARTCSGVLVQGSSVSRQPCSRSWRTMLSLIPVSIPTTCGPPPSKRTGSAGVTVRAKSAPSIDGSAAIRSRASASGVSAGKMPPRIAPLSRRWRTSARVSTPLMPGTPQSASQSSQPPSAVATSSRFLASRMTTPRAWTRSDSIAAAETP
jgi:hypothetical protein